MFIYMKTTTINLNQLYSFEEFVANFNIEANFLEYADIIRSKTSDRKKYFPIIPISILFFIFIIMKRQKECRDMYDKLKTTPEKNKKLPVHVSSKVD